MYARACIQAYVHENPQKSIDKSMLIRGIYVRCVAWHCMARNIVRILIWNSVLISVNMMPPCECHCSLDFVRSHVDMLHTSLPHLFIIIFHKLNHSVVAAAVELAALCEDYNYVNIVNAQHMIIWTESYNMHYPHIYRVGMRGDNNTGFLDNQHDSFIDHFFFAPSPVFIDHFAL